MLANFELLLFQNLMLELLINFEFDDEVFLLAEHLGGANIALFQLNCVVVHFFRLHVDRIFRTQRRLPLLVIKH